MNETDNDVYRNLSGYENKKEGINQKWTVYLMLACLTVCASSFIFGYNIGSTNLPTPLIIDFYSQRYFVDHKNNTDVYSEKTKVYEANKKIFDAVKGNSSNSTHEEAFNALKSEKTDLDAYFKETQREIDELEQSIDNVKKMNTLLWTITNTLFVVGGMVGAITSKYVAESFGRKNGILFHYIFVVIGSVLVILAPYINSPECVIISRFLFGIQGGMCCGLTPSYLSEISPNALRGATGVMHQLAVTIGILVAQVLGFRQLMGVASMWHFLLGLPIVAAFLGGFSLMFFFTETPRALIVTNKDEDAAREALIKLRNTHNVQYEIDQINQEQREANAKSDSTSISIFDLFIMRELRWPLITSIIIQVCQQFCGINAVFFYSTKIFRTAGVDPSDIQYMVALTGIVNVLMTLVCVPLIDRLGRKPLLVYPMILIVINFILMTVFLHHQVDIWYYSHLSVGCIMFFICCFAIGLGPIPFIYVAEVFGQNSRSCALAVSMLVNWTANTILTLTFPYLADLLKNDVFIVFTVIVAVAVSVIIKKVPETKGRSVEEIHDQMNGVRRKKQWTEAGKLMTNTSV